MSSLRKWFHHIKSRPYFEWIFVLPSLFLLALLALPLASLLWRGLTNGILLYITEASALSALRLSLITSTLSVLFTVITGTPLAFLLARRNFRGKYWFEILIDLPIVLPPSIAGIALLIAFGRQGLFGGWLNALGIQLPFTTAAVVIAQTFVSAPLFVRAARIGFSEIDQQLREAAYVEGCNEWQLFRYIMLPLARHSILSGSILAWTRALGEFGATILFAGNMEGVTQTMPMAIYLGFEKNIGIALALSIVLLFVSVTLLFIIRKLDQPKD
jgi:molybdate transport system permease protein